MGRIEGRRGGDARHRRGDLRQQLRQFGRAGIERPSDIPRRSTRDERTQEVDQRREDKGAAFFRTASCQRQPPQLRGSRYRLLGQARFADAGLPRDPDDTAAAAPSLLKAALDGFKLGATLDDDGADKGPADATCHSGHRLHGCGPGIPARRTLPGTNIAASKNETDRAS